MASVLFLAPDDLGETILATGALAHVLRDGDVLTVSAAAEAAPLFRAAPGVRIWLPPRTAPSFLLFSRLRGVSYDVLIDARRGMSGWLASSRARIAIRPAPSVRHRVHDWGDACGDGGALAPRLWLDEEARVWAARAVEAGRRLIVVAPGGSNPAKRWPWERFAALARRLMDGPLAGAEMLVMGAAARDRAVIENIVRSLDADGVRARAVLDEADLLAAAALMERATLCIGNDNALTHLAAAANAPTLTLAGPTDERARAPWGARARTLRAMSIEDAASFGAAGGRRAMEAIGVDAAEAAALNLLHAGGLG